jgi:hypothetical protein
MKMDFNSVGHLASTAFDFVREQSKKSVSGFSKAVSSIFQSLFRDSGKKSTFIPEYPAENQPPADNPEVNKPEVDKPEVDKPPADKPTVDDVRGTSNSQGPAGVSEAEEGETWYDYFSRYFIRYSSNLDSTNGGETKPADKPTVGKPTADKPTAGTEPAANSSLPSLTLEGKQPVTVVGNRAYVQPQLRTNHCGVMAVNGFFQAQVIQPGDLVRGIIAEDADLRKPGSSTYGGAFHPNLIDSFRKSNEGVTISEEEFKRGDHKSFVPDDNIDAQWSRLCEQVKATSNARSLSITPDHWLSERGGVGDGPMLHVMNQLLATHTAEASDPWHTYPSEVGLCFPSCEPENSNAFSDSLKNSKVDRMVCLSETQRHWFALVKSGDTWLRLDDIQCELPPNERGPEQGELCEVGQNKRVSNAQLKEQLNDWGVSEVICDKACADAYSTALQNLPS